MRPILILTAFALLAAPAAQAKVYYVNKGVKYHIGDTRFSRSTDAEFLGSHPVVGQEWIQAFSVDRKDKVRVRIEKIWGVDDCPYCHVTVTIDEWLMGRVHAVDNEVGFSTLEPLAKAVEPGRTYYLKIASVGLQADDFAFENVMVETDQAQLTLMEPGPVVKDPGEPMPLVQPPRPIPVAAGPCDSLKAQRDWLLGWVGGGAAPFSMDARPKEFSLKGPLVELKAGEAVELDLAVSRIGGVDLVSQPVELLLGPVAGRYDGWALLLDPSGGISHGNVILEGDYTAQAFKAEGLKKGGWNRVKVEHCRDGSLHLAVNGRRVPQGIKARGGKAAVSLRAMGMQLEVKAASAPGAQDEPVLPPPPD